MKKIILLLIIAAFGFSANAQEVKKNKNAKVEFHVNGNCEMCQKRIQKAALGVSGVKSADWHLDCGTLYLVINEEKTDVLSIKKAIAKVGHDTNDVKAKDEVYNDLHECCQYKRE